MKKGSDPEISVLIFVDFPQHDEAVMLDILQQCNLTRMKEEKLILHCPVSMYQQNCR